jgi:hypothetical protein
VLLSGGVLRASAYLADRVTLQIGGALPSMQVRPLNAEPVAGAVRLATALAEGRAEVPKYERRQQPRRH